MPDQRLSFNMHYVFVRFEFNRFEFVQPSIEGYRYLS